jgi:hypothetical protein
MKKCLTFLVLVICATAFTLPVSGQKDDYTGIWKLDREKSMIPEYTPVLLKITVNVKGDSLLTERVYDTGDGSEYPFEENVTLDGKEYNFNVYNMPRKTKAVISDQDGLINLESTTTFEGSNGPEDFVSKEVWKVDKAAGIMTVSVKNKTSMGENEGSYAFVKGE